MISKKLLFLLALLLISASAAFPQDKLEFTVIQGYFRTEAFKKILTEAYNKLGFQFTITELPDKRLYQVMKDHKLDGILFNNALIEVAVPGLIRIPVVIANEEVVVFSNKPGVVVVKGVSRLKPYKVGIMAGFKDYIPGAKDLTTDESNAPDQLFLKLERGRIDAAIFPKIAGLKILKQMKLTDIKALAPPLDSTPLFHYLDKKNAKLADKVTALLKEMEKNGTIKKIIDENEAAFLK